MNELGITFFIFATMSSSHSNNQNRISELDAISHPDRGVTLKRRNGMRARSLEEVGSKEAHVELLLMFSIERL